MESEVGFCFWALDNENMVLVCICLPAFATGDRSNNHSNCFYRGRSLRDVEKEKKNLGKKFLREKDC